MKVGQAVEKPRVDWLECPVMLSNRRLRSFCHETMSYTSMFSASGVPGIRDKAARSLRPGALSANLSFHGCRIRPVTSTPPSNRVF